MRWERGEDNENCTSPLCKDSSTQSDTQRELNYTYLRKQRLKKANGQKTADYYNYTNYSYYL